MFIVRRIIILGIYTLKAKIVCMYVPKYESVCVYCEKMLDEQKEQFNILQQQETG